MKEICCQDVNGFYLGTTCPKCNKPFRSIIEESKQETLEEIDLEPPIGDFILKNAKSIQRADGAYYHYSEVCKLLKLQKQRSYSKEEVLDILYQWSMYKIDIELDKLADELTDILPYNKWFEQFKKKQ